MVKKENKNILLLQFFLDTGNYSRLIVVYKPFMSGGGTIEPDFNVGVTINKKEASCSITSLPQFLCPKG